MHAKPQPSLLSREADEVVPGKEERSRPRDIQIREERRKEKTLKTLIEFWKGTPHNIPDRILEEIIGHQQHSPRAMELGVESEIVAALVMYLGSFSDTVLKTRAFINRAQSGMLLSTDAERVWKQPSIYVYDYVTKPDGTRVQIGGHREVIPWEKTGYSHLKNEVPSLAMQEAVTWETFYKQIHAALLSFGITYDQVAQLCTLKDSQSKTKLVRLLLPVFVSLQMVHGYHGNPDLSLA